MARPAGSKNKRDSDFLAEFREFEKVYGDPREFHFRVMAVKLGSKAWNAKITLEHRQRAADRLITIGYPALRSIELKDNTAEQISFAWDDLAAATDAADNAASNLAH